MLYFFKGYIIYRIEFLENGTKMVGFRNSISISIPKLRIFSLNFLEIPLRYILYLLFFKAYKIYRIEILEK